MLKYYNEFNIVPVHQGAPTDNFGNFKFQRERLYQNLGVSMNMLQGKDILEFGPGTGDNALVLLQYNPNLLHLVDGNRASMDSIEEKFQNSRNQIFKNVNCYFSDARDFLISSQKPFIGYDLVICEGMINGNDDPTNLLRHISGFVKPGGNLVITTVSSLGVLDQALRRIFKPAICLKTNIYQDQVKMACDIFKTHLNHLPTTKPIEDWVQDAILHPLDKEYTFDTGDAVTALNKEFVALGSSPSFFQDFIWHKALSRDTDYRNGMFIEQFKSMSPMLIDSSVHTHIEVANVGILENLAAQAWGISCDIWISDSYKQWEALAQILKEIVDLLQNCLPDVATAISEFSSNFENVMLGNFETPMPYFEKWWGRGLTYVSFTKNNC